MASDSARPLIGRKDSLAPAKLDLSEIAFVPLVRVKWLREVAR